MSVCNTRHLRENSTLFCVNIKKASKIYIPITNSSLISTYKKSKSTK